LSSIGWHKSPNSWLMFFHEMRICVSYLSKSVNSTPLGLDERLGVLQNARLIISIVFTLHAHYTSKLVDLTLFIISPK
jgi:hypothetical protein